MQHFADKTTLSTSAALLSDVRQWQVFTVLYSSHAGKQSYLRYQSRHPHGLLASLTLLLPLSGYCYYHYLNVNIVNIVTYLYYVQVY